MSALRLLHNALDVFLSDLRTDRAAGAAGALVRVAAEEAAARQLLVVGHEAALYAARTEAEVAVRRCAEQGFEKAAYLEHVVRAAAGELRQQEAAAGDDVPATPDGVSLVASPTPAPTPFLPQQTPWVVKGWGDAATPQSAGAAMSPPAPDDAGGLPALAASVCGRLRAALRMKHAALGALKEELTAVSAEVARLTGERDQRGLDLATRVRELQIDLDEARLGAAKWKQQYEVLDVETRTNEDALRSRVDELTGELRAARATETETQASLNDVIRQLRDAELRVTTKDSILADYDAIAARHKDEAEDLRAQLAQANAAVAQRERELLHLKSELEAANEFIEEAEEDRAELVAKAQELQAIVRLKVAEDETTERRNMIIDEHNRGVEDMWRRVGTAPAAAAPPSANASFSSQAPPPQQFAASASMAGVPMPPPRLNSSNFHPIDLYP